MSSKLVGFYIVYFLGYVGFSITMPIIPLYISSRGSDISEVGIFVSLTFYVAAFFMILFGMLADRVGARKTMIGGLIIFVISPILYTFLNTPVQIALIRILQGIGSAMYIPSALSLMMGAVPAEKRGEATGWVVSAGQMGLMCGPLIGGFLLNAFDFNGSFYGSGLIASAALVLAVVLFRRTPVTAGVASQKPPKMSWGWLRQAPMLGALFIPLLMALGSGSMNSFLPLYGTEQAISPSQIGIIIAIYYASSSILRVPFRKLTDRYGPRHMIVAGSLIFIAGMALFSLAHSFLTLSIVAVLFGLGFGLGFPAGLVAAANHAPPHARGLAMSMCTATFQVGVALGTMLMGFVANARGFETMFLVAGAIMLLELSIFFVLSRLKGSAAAIPEPK